MIWLWLHLPLDGPSFPAEPAPDFSYQLRRQISPEQHGFIHPGDLEQFLP